MNDSSNKGLNPGLITIVNKPYEYGFHTNIEKDIIKKGLNEKVIRLISKKKRNQNFY